MAERIETLKRNHESEIRALEERLQSLESASKQRRPMPHNRGKHKSPGLSHMNSMGNNPPAHFHPTQEPKAEDSKLVYPIPPLPMRRPSGIPVLMSRPSTPNSIITPNRPTYVRDLGSNSSTLVSSVHSTLSRGSIKTNESFSSVESDKRERGGESPTIRIADSGKGGDKSTMIVVKELLTKRKEPVKAEKPTWANMAAKAAEKMR